MANVLLFYAGQHRFDRVLVVSLELSTISRQLQLTAPIFRGDYSQWMLWLNIAINVAFFGVALWLTQFDVIQFDAVPDSQKWAQALAHSSITYILLGIAIISGYEIVRDARRLRRL